MFASSRQVRFLVEVRLAARRTVPKNHPCIEEFGRSHTSQREFEPRPFALS